MKSDVICFDILPLVKIAIPRKGKIFSTTPTIESTFKNHITRPSKLIFLEIYTNNKRIPMHPTKNNTKRFIILLFILLYFN